MGHPPLRTVHRTAIGREKKASLKRLTFLSAITLQCCKLIWLAVPCKSCLDMARRERDELYALTFAFALFIKKSFEVGIQRGIFGRNLTLDLPKLF